MYGPGYIGAATGGTSGLGSGRIDGFVTAGVTDAGVEMTGRTGWGETDGEGELGTAVAGCFPAALDDKGEEVDKGGRGRAGGRTGGVMGALGMTGTAVAGCFPAALDDKGEEVDEGAGARAGAREGAGRGTLGMG